MATVKLKGVDLPNFLSEDKTDYELWKAAKAIVEADIPVSEKKCYAFKKQVDLGASLRTTEIREATTDDVTEHLKACTSRPVA